MDFKTFQIVAPIVSEKFPVMMRGRHGIGKSQVVYQLAAQLNLPVIERRAAQMTEGDLIGLPRQNSEVTEFIPADWMHRACNEAVILFFDEADRGVREVQQGLFELCDSRKLYGNKLHPGTRIFAAVNSGEFNGAADYQTVEMGPAFIDRWFIADVEPSIEDWLKWAKTNVSEEVWDFINQNGNFLEHNGSHEPHKVYPSRRSWDRLSAVLDKSEWMEGLENEKDPSKNPGFFHMTQGFVGFETAVAFADFLKEYKRHVTIEDILSHGKIDLTKKWGVPEHTAMLEKFDAKGIFKRKLSKKRLENLAKYFFELPAEPAMKLWSILGHDGTKEENLTELHGMKLKDGRIVNDRLVEIITSGEFEKDENKEE